MKKSILPGLAILFLIPFLPLRADELSDLKEELETLKRESQSQSETMESLQRKIDQLEQAQKEEYERVSDIDMWKTKQEDEITFLLDEVNQHRKTLKEMVNLHVYGNIDFEDFSSEDNRFDAESIELFFETFLTPRLRFYGEVEFERPAAIGEERGGAIEFEQGYIDYIINDYVNMRAGVILIPFGKYNLKHFAPFTDLSDRPLVALQIIPTDWSEAGAGLFGSVPLTDRFVLSYEAYLINGLSDDISDEGLRDARPGFGSDNNNNKAAVGRMALNPFHGIELGLSGYFGQYDKEDNDLSGFALDWEGEYGPFELIGEYALFDPESGLNKDGIPVPAFLKGFYIQTNYHFWPKLLNDTFLGRKFVSPTFTAVFRYNAIEIDDDGDVGSGDNRERGYTIGLNYRPVETFVMKLEYQINQTKNETLVHGDENGFIFSIAYAF